MSKFRISRALCDTIASALMGSHPVLDELFLSSGAPGPPPDLPHSRKWTSWLMRINNDPSIDTLEVVGRILEQVMDVGPLTIEEDAHEVWEKKRIEVSSALGCEDLEYFHGGRLVPKGGAVPPMNSDPTKRPVSPSTVEDLLETIFRGLRRAMDPLANRRKGATSLSFSNEYDLQDLLHALLKPWISDIRPEEFTPSYAGSSTRMDFLLPKHATVIETKIVRDRRHGRSIGDELIIDIAHYRAHPNCDHLWCVVYDPYHHIGNDSALSDLEDEHANSKGKLNVKVRVVR